MALELTLVPGTAGAMAVAREVGGEEEGRGCVSEQGGAGWWSEHFKKFLTERRLEVAEREG